MVRASAGAVTPAREAVRILTPTRAVGDLARTHLLYGEWLRRRRRRAEASVELGRAHELFTATGAGLFADRAGRELAAATARRRPPRTGALTAQEEAVAELAARGATNAEIADRLSVSRHTVDYHLRKVFAHLGVNDRRRLAPALRRLPSD